MYCAHCGAEINDKAVVCVKCGCAVGDGLATKPVTQVKDDTMDVVIKIFMILGCISMGWLIVPLAWCIPMTVSVFKSLKAGRPISTGMKICVLLFVNMIGGICLLCCDDK